MMQPAKMSTPCYGLLTTDSNQHRFAAQVLGDRFLIHQQRFMPD